MICYTEHDSPLGTLLLAASGKGLCGLYFDEHKYFAGPRGWTRDDDHPVLGAAKRQLDDYFASGRDRFELPLDLPGTPFQQAVWRELLALPFGTTDTYSAIARRVGRAAAVRAAGTAIGRNPVSIVVPCHRVLGMSGALSGYAGGLARKRYLLALEGNHAGAGMTGR